VPSESARSAAELAGVKTRREFVDQAIVFLGWAIGERAKGRVIASVDADSGGYREVVLPAFSTLNYATKNKAAGSAQAPATAGAA